MAMQFLTYLEAYGPLLGDELQAVAKLVRAARRFAAGAEIVEEGQRPSHCSVLVSGHAFRHRTLPDGRRQILSFSVPGDLCDLQGLFLSMDHGVCALSPCEVAFISHADLEAAMDAYPALGRALWRLNLIEAAVFREWLVGVGRRSAYARIAHLLCEVAVRLKDGAVSDGDRLRFPVTQAHLSDALGLSVVHTNRVLQALRSEGVIAMRGGDLLIKDWAGLQAAGEFDAAYLHLGPLMSPGREGVAPASFNQW
jgi:CRP-like cAMP-binding protein